MSPHSLGTLIEWKQLFEARFYFVNSLGAVPTRWGH